MDPSQSPLPAAPDWSVSLGFVGRGFIFLAILSFVAAIGLWIMVKRNEGLQRFAKAAFTTGCLSLFGAFASLATLFITNRLEFAYVWEHGDGTNTIPYRVAGIWAGQQGSFLLWSCCSALFGLLAVGGTGVLRRWFTVAYSGFLAAIACILAYESPFGLNLWHGQPVVPMRGNGLVPALQNYWVTIHPPTIFLGFGSLTVLACYAFSALASNERKIWAPMVRPWALVSLTFVGVGLCMGGFWAYETLGWGGFWMWDPVENVSFVPWVFTAALVHGLMVQITKKKWRNTNLFLGGMPFLLFVYGTFLTRSGVLGDTSVHSFANMDHIALRLLLGFLVISSLTFLGLWGWRALQWQKEKEPVEPEPKGMHREALFRIGAWLLALFGVGAAVGMSWPMLMAIAGQKPKVVEESLYHSTLTYLYFPLMLAMGIGPLVAWRGMGAREFGKRVYGVLCVTIAGVGIMMMLVGRSPWTNSLPADSFINLPFGKHVGTMPWIVLLASLSIFVIVANLWRIAELIKRSKISAAAFLAHVGVAVLMAGLIISRGFEQKTFIQVKPNQPDTGLGYLVAYKGLTGPDAFDRNNKALFDVQNATEKWTATPGLYYTEGPEGEPQPMVWPHIQSHPFYDIYFAMRPPTNELGVAMTLKPGETSKVNGFDVTYEKMVREGEPGKVGTKFGALLRFSSGHATVEVTPKIELTSAGMKDHPATLSDGVLVSLQGMQAGSDSVTIQLLSDEPIFPIDMFYKPMTILVWLGTGIIAIAGLLSAWYRRVPRGKTAPPA